MLGRHEGKTAQQMNGPQLQRVTWCSLLLSPAQLALAVALLSAGQAQCFLAGHCAAQPPARKQMADT